MMLQGWVLQILNIPDVIYIAWTWSNKEEHALRRELGDTAYRFLTFLKSLTSRKQSLYLFLS